MSVYSSGTVDVEIGSAAVKGNSTDFVTYANTGYLFRIVGESVYYEIAAVTNATNLSLSENYSNSNYSVGSPLEEASYQIVTSYTPNYSFPEMGPNDTGIAYIFTKSMRDIDSALFNASVNSIMCASDIEVTASNHGLILRSSDNTRWRLTIDNNGSIQIGSLP